MKQPLVYTFEEWIKESKIKDKCKHCGRKLTSTNCDGFASHREVLYSLYLKQKREDVEKWNQYHEFLNK